MYKIYKVQKGETTEDVAKKFNISTAELKRINGGESMLDTKEGNLIIVPLQEGAYFDTYTIQKGDTIYAIARKFGAGEMELLKLNGLDKNDYIYPGEEILVPKKDVRFLITGEGDTINTASEKLDVRPGQILLQNDNVYLLPEQLLVYREIE